MDLPSGDQAGSRSATTAELVILRMSPFSAGTVKISPCASKTARAPVGDICGVLDLLLDLLKARPDLRHVAVCRDANPLGLAGMQLIEINGAELLVDDGARSRRGVFDVEPLVLDELPHLL